VCIVGRMADCTLRIPDKPSENFASRYHCLIDINPPEIAVRDFGSLNGTYINGEKIGQRPRDTTAEEAREQHYPERVLYTGDEIGLGDTVLAVEQHSPARCARCGSEIPESEPPVSPAALCLQCEAETQDRTSPPVSPAARTTCLGCGLETNPGDGILSIDVPLCVPCKANPTAMMGHLMSQAAHGATELAAIKDYVIQEELGRGAMGAAYLATHKKFGHQVALKIMLPHVALNEQSMSYFLREIDNTKALDHPNLVRLYDHGAAAEVFFFAVQYCNGGDLEAVARTHGNQLPIDLAAGYILQVLDGLAYAH
jgi:eukaryotic-like serine/threonine-protein kinase